MSTTPAIETAGPRALVPTSWYDVRHPHHKPATVQQLYNLIQDRLKDDQASPLEHAPYDDGDWEEMASLEIDPHLLRLLVSADDKGMGLSNTGAFLLITRTMCNTLELLYKFTINHPKANAASGTPEGTDGAQFAMRFTYSSILDVLGIQFVSSHADDLTKWLTFVAYSSTFKEDHERPITREPHGAFHYHTERFDYVTMCYAQRTVLPAM